MCIYLDTNRIHDCYINGGNYMIIHRIYYIQYTLSYINKYIHLDKFI